MMRARSVSLVGGMLAAALVAVAGCGGGNKAGTGGNGGAVGTAGTGGASDGGSGGGAGAVGTAGTGGSGTGGGPTGTAGTVAAAGRGGTTGTAGTGGTIGAAGTGGAAGRGGATGVAGTSGAAGRGGTTGIAGAAGAAGRGGTTGTGGTGGSSTAGGQSVLERNKNPSRDGHFIQAGLTKTAVAGMVATPGFTGTFSGEMYASPLYLENGPGGKGVLFAVNSDNGVFALDENTAATVWTHSIGSAPQDSGAGCGGIHPIGIISTPVIDAASRTIFVAGAIGTSTIARHEVHALSVDDGSEKTGWPVNVSTVPASGGITFMPQPSNQRSALSLVGGVVYVAYGGHNGDCGPYHGWIVGVNAANPAMIGGWATGGLGEGIWASAGMASDGNGVFASTGNRNTATSRNTHQDSEEVVRVTGLGTRADTFYPTTPASGSTPRWLSMDDDDTDLGSVNPVYAQLPGATPQNLVLAASKDGHLYILDAANLGGADGRKVDFTVASGGDAIYAPPTVYRTPTGLYYVVATSTNATRCPAGSGVTGGSALVAVRIAPGNPPVPSIVWCSALAGDPSGPIATTTNGTDNAVVWVVNNGRLKALDGDTGAALYTSSSSCDVQHWTSPIAFKNRIVVGGNGRLCSWSLP